MCFYISEKSLAKKYFKFLKRRGFRSKSYYRNGDFEIIYTNRKAHFIVEVYGYLAGTIKYEPNTNHIDIDKSIKNSVYAVSVNVQRHYWGNNILYCDFFDKERRKKLRADIENTNTNDIEQQLKIYSEFLKNELDNLNI